MQVSLRHAFFCLWPDPKTGVGGIQSALSQGPVIPFLAHMSLRCWLKAKGDRLLGQSHGATRERLSCLPRVAVALVGEVDTSRVGLVGMSLGVKRPVSVTREGDARISVKTCYWDYFSGEETGHLGRVCRQGASV